MKNKLKSISTEEEKEKEIKEKEAEEKRLEETGEDEEDLSFQELRKFLDVQKLVLKMYVEEWMVCDPW
ncbi:hypothetical protein QE152_g8866 [Popillia japonica]|uniref:Uncharacterized protein n=1 Tax=Popillia japonica TaxID=7064 RepID=A0AAW1M1V9_POPJA